MSPAPRGPRAAAKNTPTAEDAPDKGLPAWRGRGGGPGSFREPAAPLARAAARAGLAEAQIPPRSAFRERASRPGRGTARRAGPGASSVQECGRRRGEFRGELGLNKASERSNLHVPRVICNNHCSYLLFSTEKDSDSVVHTPDIYITLNNKCFHHSILT